MSVSSSEGASSTLYNVFEEDILDAQVCIPLFQWLSTPRYEAEYALGQSSKERTKQLIQDVNCTITRLQNSGIHTHAIELEVEQSIIDLDVENDLWVP